MLSQECREFKESSLSENKENRSGADLCENMDESKACQFRRLSKYKGCGSMTSNEVEVTFEISGSAHRRSPAHTDGSDVLQHAAI